MRDVAEAREGDLEVPEVTTANGHEVSAGRADVAEQESLCEDLRRTVLLQIEVAPMHPEEARELASRYESDILPQTGNVTRTTELGFRAGASTIMDVLDAQRTLRSVQTKSRGAVAEYLKAQAALDRATGGAVQHVGEQAPALGERTNAQRPDTGRPRPLGYLRSAIGGWRAIRDDVLNFVRSEECWERGHRAA